MSKRVKKVFVYGRDNVGWSIDKDRENLEFAIKELGYKITKFPFFADYILVVWWNRLLDKKLSIIRFFSKKSKIVAFITNDPNHQNIFFKKVKKIVHLWVCANNFQRDFLRFNKIEESKIFINPFYVNEKQFLKLNDSKKKLSTDLGIDYKKIKNKFIIGSFQRDSQGDNLLKPKWQKDPDFLIDIMIELNSSNFVLLLAGPRRHYIVNRCKKFKIPFIYIGDINFINSKTDDIFVNNLDYATINKLYNLIDLSIVTSKSEGGPKALIESSLTKTLALSTQVGFSNLILDKEAICATEKEFSRKILNSYKDREYRDNLIQKNYRKTISINNRNSYLKRIKEILSK